MHQNSELLLTRREAAERLRVSQRKLDGMLATGELPHVHLGRRVLVRAGDLKALIDAAVAVGRGVAR